MTEPRRFLPPWARGLSARLLLLTMVFVMVSEILIYLPSIARFRHSYLEVRLSNAHLAILALDSTTASTVDTLLTQRLLDHAEASAIVVRSPGHGTIMLMHDQVPQPDVTVDLRAMSWYVEIGEALRTLAADEGRILRVIGESPKAPGVTVEVLMRESALRRAMIGYSQRILALSIVISLLTAGLVYLSLHYLMVRPMRRLTESMVAFRADPDNPGSAIGPSRRGDEIGVATRELAEMQSGLVQALRQKAHLAALGEAVGKINHDLRNILSTARLVSDRLTASADPYVRKTAPTLLDAIDKAVDLCSRTLEFTREEPPAPRRTRFGLRDLIEEVIAGLAPAAIGVRWLNDIDPALQISADRDQLYRAISNLARNAMEAGAGRIAFKAARTAERVGMIVGDDGPGIPAAAREHLFQPFAGSTRRGGTGLGLPIAREVLRAHGGDVTLQESGPGGTRFRIELPDDQPALRGDGQDLSRRAIS
ncbi:MAG: HAMP domain-containing histidine kinase [Alphaproteobacteria bacterium]|nr:HAMP domain-containing histidine kinase [Alphaproteobacteria bacterium]